MISQQLFDSKNYQRSLVHAYVRVAIGATGAVGTHVGKGIVVTRTDTGDYTATLQRVVNGLGKIMYADVRVVTDADVGSTARLRALSESAGTVTFTCSDDDAIGTPADPAEGAILLVHIVVRNSGSDQT